MQTSRQAQLTVRHALRYFMYKKAFYQLKAQSEDEEEKNKALNSKFMRLLKKNSGENYTISKLLERDSVSNDSFNQVKDAEVQKNLEV